MSYTLGFQQSYTEREKQLQLISKYAANPHIREQAKEKLKATLERKQSLPIEYTLEQPFPNYSFETTEIVCQGGTCERIIHDSEYVPVDLTDPFRIEKS